MSNDSGFLEAAENATTEKLLSLASKMIRAEEIIASLVESFALAKKSDHVLREYLLQSAELARLKRGVDEVIRNHEILCSSCGQPHHLRSVAPLGVLPRVKFRCPNGNAFDELKYIGKVEQESLTRILRFAQCDVKEIFDTKVP